MRSFAYVTAVFALCAAGCSQKHLIKDWGESYVRAFQVQQVEPDPAKPPPQAILGLDSQEAAITAENYRATLVPKGEKVEEQPMILVAPPSRERREPLAPSVPKE